MTPHGPSRFSDFVQQPTDSDPQTITTSRAPNVPDLLPGCGRARARSLSSAPCDSAEDGAQDAGRRAREGEEGAAAPGQPAVSPPAHLPPELRCNMEEREPPRAACNTSRWMAGVFAHWALQENCARRASERRLSGAAAAPKRRWIGARAAPGRGRSNNALRTTTEPSFLHGAIRRACRKNARPRHTN